MSGREGEEVLGMPKVPRVLDEKVLKVQGGGNCFIVVFFLEL